MSHVLVLWTPFQARELMLLPCWYCGAYAVLGDIHSCSISQNVYLHSTQQAHTVGLVRALLIGLNCWCPTVPDIGVLTQSPSVVA